MRIKKPNYTTIEKRINLLAKELVKTPMDIRKKKMLFKNFKDFFQINIDIDISGNLIPENARVNVIAPVSIDSDGGKFTGMSYCSFQNAKDILISSQPSVNTVIRQYEKVTYKNGKIKRIYLK